MPALTPNFSLNEPKVNNVEDQDLWGGQLNNNWSRTDSLLTWFTVTKSATFAVASSEFNFRYLVDTSAGAVTADLPTGLFNGFTVGFIVTDNTSGLTLDPDGSETIDGNATLVVANNSIIIYDGSNWHSQGAGLEASESTPGVLAIATTAEARAQVVDNKTITPLKLGQVTTTTSRLGLGELATEGEMEVESAAAALVVGPNQVKNSPGVAKAWINFNGTGSVSIRDDYNISSIVDNGTGQYEINIATNFSNADYAITGTSSGTNQTTVNAVFVNQTSSPTTGTVDIFTATEGGAIDRQIVSLAMFGDQ